jgi:transposase
MPTTPRIIKLHYKTRDKLVLLKKEAERVGEYRVAKRIHAVLLNYQENTSTRIANLLHAPRSKVSEWLKNYEAHGIEGLLEGQRTGRIPSLSDEQFIELGDIIDSGPIAYGYTSAIWTSIMIRDIIKSEFSVSYHPGHVRKLLHKMNFSVQKPKRVLARADEEEKNKWRRYIYPNIKKKPVNLAQ